MHRIAPNLQPNHSFKHNYYIKPTNKYLLAFIHLDMFEPFSVAELSLKTRITFPCVSKVPTAPTSLGKQSEFLALFQMQSEGNHMKNVNLHGSQTFISNILKKPYCFRVKNRWFLGTGTKSMLFGNRPLESHSDVLFQVLHTDKISLKGLGFSKAICKHVCFMT